MAIREIRTFDDPVLRKKCRKVETADDHVRQILSDMVDTMYQTPNGGGLAANQVGILKRLVVMDMGSGLYQLINPEIIDQSGEQLVTEGCLSFPGVWGELKRPQKVVVRAQNEKGEEITFEAEDALAKCVCHELDHLEGIVFTDKVIRYVK
jgi:peptide deformylase